jgi:hypothetical protein
MRVRIAHGAEGEAEGVGHETRERGLDDPRDVRGGGDRDGRDPRAVKSALEQPDRLLADRSSGHQECEIDLLGAQVADGERRKTLEDGAAVGDEAHGRDRRGGQ